jgi:hypothetical protein
VTANLIASLAELEKRHLYLGQGYASLFSYCTEALGLSEDSAYFRITAARAALRFPLILERLADGHTTLTAVKLLAPHLTEDNCREALDAARGKSKRAVEEMVARLQARPDVPSTVRKLPPPKPTLGLTPAAPASEDRSPVANDRTAKMWAGGASAGSVLDLAREADRCEASPPPATERIEAGPQGVRPGVAQPVRPAVVTPLAPERYKVQMTVSGETHARLRRVQALLRHSIPNGDLALIFDRALVVLEEHLERTKWAATKQKTGSEATTTPRSSRGGRSRSTVTLGGANRAAAGRQPRAGGEYLAPSGEPAPGDTANNGSEEPDQKRTAEGEGVDRELDPERVPGRVEKRRSRRIPAAVRRAVWKRDRGQCTFIGANGHRCTERGMLEFHHVVPYADGGAATAGNIVLYCRRHNGLEAERHLGPG